MPEITDLEKRTWVQKFKVAGVVIATIAGVFGLGTTLKAAGIPMFVFTNGLAELQQLNEMKFRELYVLQAQAEVDARNRIDRSNQMSMFDMQVKIEEYKKQGTGIPQPVIEQFMRQKSETEENIKLRDLAVKRIELNSMMKR